MNPILAIDPGNQLTAFVLWSPDSKQIMMFEKVENFQVRNLIRAIDYPFDVALEMVASYGMSVGKEIFETVRWIGIFQEACESRGNRVELIYRKEIKIHHCGTTKAKDTNIRQALIDRLGAPGTKKAPGITYGIKADMWSALAIALYADDNKVFERK